MKRVFSCKAIWLVLSLLFLGPSTGLGAPDRNLEEAKASYAKTKKRLDDILERYQNLHAEKVEEAKQELSREYSRAIAKATERGDLDAANSLLAELEALEGGATPAASPAVQPKNFSLTPSDSIDKRKLYRSMLGIYGRHYKPSDDHPVVSLVIPDRNLWTSAIQDQLRGKIDFKDIDYTGTAKIIVPEEGVYTFEIHNGLCKLDDNQVNAGDITLKKGTREINFHTSNYGSGRMPTASLRIIHKDTKEELPLVNTGSEIQRFLKQRVNREPVVNVSDWEPVEVAPE